MSLASREQKDANLLDMSWVAAFLPVFWKKQSGVRSKSRVCWFYAFCWLLLWLSTREVKNGTTIADVFGLLRAEKISF